MNHGRTARATPAPRLLTGPKRDVLIALLTYADFAGRAALLDQVDGARVVGACGCGCATVDLAVGACKQSDSVAYPIPSEATVVDAQGEAIGGVLVFARDGRLAQLEVYSYADEPINPFPAVDRLVLSSLPR